ncbi:hypothetical protein HanRHA438_Chr01g0030021 [Helianthus annuus]|nr:hypothetical protein HanRHA438_Chr01g0030021 [Helianthus annuus]
MFVPLSIHLSPATSLYNHQQPLLSRSPPLFSTKHRHCSTQTAAHLPPLPEHHCS